MCKRCVENMIKNRYRLILAKRINHYPVKDLERLLGKNRSTIWRWEQRLNEKGLSGLVNQSRRPYHHPEEYSRQVKELIYEIRKKYQIGPDKIRLKLIKYYDITLSVSGIAKELKRSGLIKNKSKKRKNSCSCFKKQIYLPGDVIQADVKFVFKSRSSQLFQFSAIDLATCLANSSIVESAGNYEAINFLKITNLFYPFAIKYIQTDNASYFTNYYTGYQKSADPQKPRIHPFDLECDKLNIEHLLIDKGKPQQNGKVERFHRTIDDEFYNRYRFKNKDHLLSCFKEYLYYYNHEREHLSLNGLTPLEKLKTYPNYQHIQSLKII